MARPRESTEAASVDLRIRLTPTLLDLVDHARGDLTRSAYIRDLIRDHLGPDTIEVPMPAVPTGYTDTPPVADVPRASLSVVRHLHRYKQIGPPLRHDQGVPIYLHVCDCGSEKEDR